MFCPKCGDNIPDTAAICPNCNERLGQAPPQQPPPPLYQQPPPVQNYPYQQPYYGVPPATIPGDSEATTSMVCGIIGLVTGLGIILGVIAVIYGNKAKRLGNTGGKATGGIVMGIISIIFSIIVIILVIAAIAAATSIVSRYVPDYSDLFEYFN